MNGAQLLTIAISVVTPLSTVAFLAGRFAQKADGLKESIDKGFALLAEREAAQDAKLDTHNSRLVSLETWRDILDHG